MSDTLTRLREALSDRHELQRELGAGGMATVYLAHDIKHDRDVAIKVLRPDIAESINRDRFIREIAITARLNHPNILPLLDSGEAEGFFYYGMPLATGESLQDRLRREGALPVGEALRLASEVTEALAYAHSHGVVHRDIKPANVLLSQGHAIVADFGIATALKTMRDAGTLTMDGTSLGTPTYMAPEQATGEGHVDNRADIYAVGVMVYEMLAGAPPFAGTWAQIMADKLFWSARTPASFHCPQNRPRHRQPQATVPFRMLPRLHSALQYEFDARLPC